MIGVQKKVVLALGKTSENVRVTIHSFSVHIFIEQLLCAKNTTVVKTGSQSSQFLVRSVFYFT